MAHELELALSSIGGVDEKVHNLHESWNIVQFFKLICKLGKTSLVIKTEFMKILESIIYVCQTGLLPDAKCTESQLFSS